MSQLVMLFVKNPEPGMVKTRLGATVGPDVAAEIYRTLVAEVCRRLPEEGAEIAIVFDPPARVLEVERWLRPLLANRVLKFWPQRAGGLGERLSGAFEDAFAANYQRVVVIGSDCIDLEPALFSQSFAALTDVDAVLGPSEDGGYYLLGLRAPAPQLFVGIDWSTDQVLSQTVARVEQAGWNFVVLPKLADVDTEEDWVKVRSRLTAVGSPSGAV